MLARESHGSESMTPEEELAQQSQENAPRCPKCAARIRLAFSMLEPRAGKRIRIYKCTQCRDFVWDD